MGYLYGELKSNLNRELWATVWSFKVIPLKGQGHWGLMVTNHLSTSGLSTKDPQSRTLFSPGKPGHLPPLMCLHFQLLSAIGWGLPLSDINSLAFPVHPTCAQSRLQELKKSSGKVTDARYWTLDFHVQKGECWGKIDRIPTAPVTQLTFIDNYVQSIVLFTLQEFFHLIVSRAFWGSESYCPHFAEL